MAVASIGHRRTPGDWRNQLDRMETGARRAAPGWDEAEGPIYRVQHDRLTLARMVVSPIEASEWIATLVEQGRAGAKGSLPEVASLLSKPIAPIRVSRHLQSAASDFMSAAVRPGTGFLFPGRPIDIDVPEFWEEARLVNPPLIAGLHVPRASGGGVLLVRLERRAWISGLRAGADFETYDCTIGLDPSRIDPEELSVTFLEWIDGELVQGHQVNLDRLAIDKARGHETFQLALPTLGSGVERTVRLHDRSGALLDGTSDRVSTVESVRVAMRFAGPDQRLDDPDLPKQTFTLGTPQPAPGLVERADASERVRAQLAELFAEGADRTLIPPGQAKSAIRERQAAARGTIRAVDRYFGKDPTDWDVFDRAAGPIELLMSHGAPPPPGVRTDITTRRHVHGRPPFHGRAYLWENGGLLVDASPSGFGHSPVVVDSLSAEVAQAYHAMFAVWWAMAKAVSWAG